MNKLFACTLAAAAFAAAPSISSAADAATIVATLPAPLICQGSVPAMSELQKRVVVKANQGPDALRNFVYITRGIYALDMTEVAGWLDEQRATQGGCATVASSKP